MMNQEKGALSVKELDFKQRMGILKKNILLSKESYLLLAPFALVFITFTVIPVMMSMGLSFTYYNILEPPQWIGWRNYVNLLLNDEVFVIAIQNTMVFALITGPIGYLLSLLVAWMINELKPKLRSIFVLIFYSPTITFAIYYVFQAFFNGDDKGWLNATLLDMGILQEPINWLYDANYIRPIVIIVLLWMSMGFNFLSIIAGLQGVDKSLYEAAWIDGVKNRWQELWYITLPAIKPQLMFAAVMTITGSFTLQGQISLLVGNPSTDYAARTIMTHLVDYGYTRFDMGYASAIATVLFAMMIILNRIIQNLLKKVGT